MVDAAGGPARLKRLSGWLPLGATLAVGAVVLTRGDAVLAMLAQASLGPLVIGVLAHVATVVLRFEAWRIALHAVGGGPVCRRRLHAATSAGNLAGTLASHLSVPACVAMLRRGDPAGVPSARDMLVAELPVLAVEVGLLALLTIVFSPLIALAGLVLAAAVVALAVRFRHLPAAAGLAVLGRPGRRAALVALLVLVTLLGVVRAWGVLAGLGLEAGPAEATALFLALSVAGALPIGPAAAPSAGLVLAGGVTAAAAIGAAAIATTAVAAIVYAGVAWVVAWRPRPGRTTATRIGPEPAEASLRTFRCYDHQKSETNAA